MKTVKVVKSFLSTFDQQVLKGRLFLIWHGVLGRRYRRIQGMNENPIFIGGCGRSGTSLLLSLLSVHTNIYAVPYETTIFCPGAYSDDASSEVFQINALYNHLLENQVPLRRCKRWCEKTPKNIHFAERILSYFGSGARFIHIVRDGRNVVTSTHPADPTRYWVSPKRWVEDVRAGRAVGKHPQGLTIRYEDLTADTTSVLNRLCDFLDEP